MSDTNNAIVTMGKILKSAQIGQAMADRERLIQTIEIDLEQERPEHDPLEFNSGFKSIFFESCINKETGAEDADAFVYFKPNGKNSGQDAMKLKPNGSWVIDTMVARAFFHWPAQGKKKVILKVFFASEYRSGSQVSFVTGSLDSKISEGSQVTGPHAVNLVANTAAIIVPADADRNVAQVQNKTGGDLYVGSDNSVNSTTNEGIKIPADGIIEWKNKGSLYGFSVAGGKVTRLEEK